MSKDYKNFIEGKYPEPKDRMNVKDYPKPEELFIYGEDIPVPTTEEELRYKYPFPPGVELKDLEGRRVPPFGLSYVSKAGGGGKRGFVYKPGTFFENKVTINKELGKTTKELTLVKAEHQEQAMLDNIGKALAEDGHKLDGTASADVLGKLAYVLTKKLLDDDAPVRELRMWYGDIVKTLVSKQETIKNTRDTLTLEIGKMNIKMLDKLLDGVDGLIADKQDEELLDLELHDVDSEAD